ncbi:hypothetical protein GCM10027087_29000 [Paractinoplanes abujensis]
MLDPVRASSIGSTFSGSKQATSTSGSARYGVPRQSLWNLIIVGSLVSIVPLIVAFLTLQRYWQGGLSVGSLK